MHMVGSVVRDVFREVTAEAMLTTGERRDKEKKKQLELLARWKDEFLSEWQSWRDSFLAEVAEAKQSA